MNRGETETLTYVPNGDPGKLPGLDFYLRSSRRRVNSPVARIAWLVMQAWEAKMPKMPGIRGVFDAGHGLYRPVSSVLAVALGVVLWSSGALALTPDPITPPQGLTTWRTADDVNGELIARGQNIYGNYPEYNYDFYDTRSFDTGLNVANVVTSQTEYLVRVYKKGAQSPTGRWLMHASSIRGLTPQQISDYFALPVQQPDSVSIVRVPAGTRFWVGRAGAITEFPPSFSAAPGNGGGLQFYNPYFAPPTSSDPSKPWVPTSPWTGTEDTSVFFLDAKYYEVTDRPLGAQALFYGPRLPDGNSKAVGDYFDHLPKAPFYSDLEFVYNMLDFLPDAKLRTAMNRIGPERYDALSQLGVRDGLLFGNALLQRGDERLGKKPGQGSVPVETAGITGKVSVGLALGIPTPSIEREENPLQLWGRGLGAFGTQGGLAESTGFDFRTQGLVLGVDRKIGAHGLIGLGSGYTWNEFDWSEASGRGTIRSASIGLYGSYSPKRFFVDGAISGGPCRTNAGRRVYFDGLDRTAVAHIDGSRTGFQVQAGIKRTLAKWDLKPTLGLAYFDLPQDPFTENGATALNLAVSAFGTRTFRTELSLAGSREFVRTGRATCLPEFRLGWAHQTVCGDRSLTAALVGEPGTFTVAGYGKARDSILIGAGVKMCGRGRTSSFFRYDGEIGDGLTVHAISSGMQIRF